jgi:hypothetical protein
MLPKNRPFFNFIFISFKFEILNAVFSKIENEFLFTNDLYKMREIHVTALHKHYTKSRLMGHWNLV